MQITNQGSILKVAVNVVLLTAGLLMSALGVSDEQKNKLADFKAFGQWEVWCIDMAQTGNIVCNLNQVLRYKNHPDFRAMIPRFFTDGRQVTRMEIDREWQTGFGRAYIQVDDHEPLSLAECAKPCIVEGEMLDRLIAQFSSGSKASIYFHDYLVEEFDVDISLTEFPQAVETLKNMQSGF